jgi:DNA repair exonuclease SbcCD ATPase subunit
MEFDMFSLDLIITFAFMALLFLRQIVIFKQPNKINYSPLLLGIGAIGSMTHLLLDPSHSDFYILFREALLPMFFGLLLYIIMNILHQTQVGIQNQQRSDILSRFAIEVEHIKKNIETSEVRLQSLNATELEIKHILEKFSNIDFTSLKNIEENQKTFLEKFETISDRQSEVIRKFESFSEEKMPDIDSVIHRHIDLLRIAEQDHYNHIKKALLIISNDNKEIHKSFHKIENTKSQTVISDDKIKEVILKTDNLLQQVVTDFERQMISLRAQSEGIATAMSESDNLVGNIREQEELIMSQLLLSSQRMSELHEKSAEVKNIYEPLTELIQSIKEIKADYTDARNQLGMLTDSLQSVEEFQFEKMREHIENLSDTITDKIEQSLENLHEHYNIAQKDITKTVKELSSKAKMAQSYKGDE